MQPWIREITLRYTARVSGTHVILKVCPFCGNEHWNFEISKTQSVFNCWSCNAGKGKTTKDLVSILDVAFPIQAAPFVAKDAAASIVLPASRLLLLDGTSKLEQLALQYLHSGGVSDSTIVDWAVRVATGDDVQEAGLNLFGYLIVPFYGFLGLEYYIAAKFLPTSGQRYLTPSTTKDRYIPKRRDSDTLVVVEGLFDGIAVWQNTNSDVLILSGKHLGDYQKRMLKEASYKMVYACLDGDAWEQNINLAEQLFKGSINVSAVMLPAGKDPDNERHNLAEHLRNAVHISDVIICNQLRRKYLNGW